eukprot:sb/3475691/
MSIFGHVMTSLYTIFGHYLRGRWEIQDGRYMAGPLHFYFSRIPSSDRSHPSLPPPPLRMGGTMSEEGFEYGDFDRMMSTISNLIEWVNTQHGLTVGKEASRDRAPKMQLQHCTCQVKDIKLDLY